jgi:hypothetical protein
MGETDRDLRSETPAGVATPLAIDGKGSVSPKATALLTYRKHLQALGTNRAAWDDRSVMPRAF